MDIVLIILGIVLLLVGLIGCVIPALPGPPIAFGALLLLLLHSNTLIHPETSTLVWSAILVVIVTALDYVLPVWGTKRFGGSKAGKYGSIIGLVVGLFFSPWGLILGPFLGAVIGELTTGAETQKALRSGLGSFLGFAAGTVLKLAVTVYIIFYFVIAVVPG
jgi:uncharacterized protein YqgC (DUF456 family)